MAVSISISISQNSQSNTNRSSNVTVSLKCRWTYGSWNAMSPPGYLTINGTKYNFRSSFNTGRSQTGSQTLYTKTVTIKHDSNGKKTLSCSASFSTGVSSGTVKTSASKTLTPIAATSPGTSSSSSNKATITDFGLQIGTDRTVYAVWKWSKNYTDYYQIVWYYATGNGIWFIGEDTTTKYTQCTYNAPSNATKVRFKVKPVSKKHTVNKKSVSYWTASWSTYKDYSFTSNPPLKPSTPTVTVEKYNLTAELDNLNVNATSIQFQVVKDDTSVFKTGTSSIITNHASFSCTIDAGGEYKVRARSYRDSDKEYSEWSDYSSGVKTIPSAPSEITVIKATSKTSIYLEWEAVSTAKTYDIEYATKINYFDGSNGTTTITGIEFTKYEKIGLETGEEYFFRVRAVNDLGSSSWSEIKSVVIGKPPAAPTTWSSTTTCIVGEPLTLYWVHNAQDGSTQTYAELELYIDGNKETYTIENNVEDEDNKDKTSFYEIDTTEYNEGSKIQWRVRTAGVTKEYGDWSIQRTVDIYAPATLELSVTDIDGEPIEILSSFPFYIYALSGPKTQSPIGYHLTIISNEDYETVDDIGNNKIIKEGDELYSKYFDITDTLLVEMSAGNIDLENNIEYTITCTVSMNSGLTAEATSTFIVGWMDEINEPNAEIGVDESTYTASIRPFCEDEEGNLIEGVLLSVYRREFDGTFTELGVNLENSRSTFVTDPHPALDYARYRIVAITESTGAVGFYDVPGYPLGEKAVIIQWDEDWSTFDTSSSDEMVKPPWSGSLLRLPYNIDVSDNNKSDVSLIKYIGRKYPVSYYGTQLNSTSTWNVAIPKNDEETLYTLRRLAIWQGDVYVREPSGSGYWANISVSFSQKHKQLTIPVTLNITRVIGGA